MYKQTTEIVQKAAFGLWGFYCTMGVMLGD